jgi:hypothetical protein
VEDTLKSLRSFLGLAIFLALFWPAGAGLRAVQPKSSPKTEKSQAEKVAPVASRVWKSKITGNEYRVWTENSRLHAEWLNIPPGSAAKGAYIHTVCRRVGQKWIGESRSYVPCLAGQGKDEHLINFCHVTTGFEIDTLTESSMTGRAEGLKRFDCAKCTVLEKEWKKFEWVPKQ